MVLIKVQILLEVISLGSWRDCLWELIDATDLAILYTSIYGLIENIWRYEKYHINL